MSDEYWVRDFMTSPAKSIAHDARLLEAALILRSTGLAEMVGV